MSRKMAEANRVPLVERYPTSIYQFKTVLYAVGFSDGRVKFGKTQTPRERLRGLCRGDSHMAIWAHLFGPVAGSARGKPCAAECRAWQLAAAAGAKRLGRSEYFLGLTKAQAIHCGRSARLAERPAA